MTAIINGNNARNDPNTHASTTSAPSPPTSSSASTEELPLLVVVPSASDFRLVPPTLSDGAADLAAWVIASTAVESMSLPCPGG